jgi:hypothetical protein
LDDSAYAITKSNQLPSKDFELLVNVAHPSPPRITGDEDGSDESSPTPNKSGSDEGRAMLFGRYMGQIKARIERVWEHPQSTHVDAFDCKVQIRQNNQGDVLEC